MIGQDVHKKSIKDRFFSKVDRSNGVVGCWNWLGANNGRGYGQFVVSYYAGVIQKIGAHRFSRILHAGEIPKGMDVCHSCDNQRCVNPRHLWIGSRLENVTDMMKKGRHRPGKTIGSKHHNATIDEQGVSTILQLISLGHTQKEIAKKYGVAYQTIGRIKRGTSWTHVNRMIGE